jgi:hypothetical protein
MPKQNAPTPPVEAKAPVEVEAAAVVAVEVPGPVEVAPQPEAPPFTALEPKVSFPTNDEMATTLVLIASPAKTAEIKAAAAARNAATAAALSAFAAASPEFKRWQEADRSLNDLVAQREKAATERSQVDKAARELATIDRLDELGAAEEAAEKRLARIAKSLPWVIREQRVRANVLLVAVAAEATREQNSVKAELDEARRQLAALSGITPEWLERLNVLEVLWGTRRGGSTVADGEARRALRPLIGDVPAMPLPIEEPQPQQQGGAMQYSFTPASVPPPRPLPPSAPIRQVGYVPIGEPVPVATPAEVEVAAK